MTQLTERFSHAVDYARVAHATQVRKGSNIPYLYHLLGVASLVLEYGGDEDQAIAGLLHDVLEDCGAKHEPIIRERFGVAVADIVLACTDGTVEGKESAEGSGRALDHWRARKLAYLAHLESEGDYALLVSGCDKLHNARAILADLENPAVGLSVFERFTAKQPGTLQYYHAISSIMEKRRMPMAHALEATVAKAHGIAGVTMREGLR